ncbi:hypothetical protein ABLT35_16345 [Acinetobacter johnsonii]|jgi:hypothetical protein|uniref:hypothetical protein n=1 Tax=Acinetobacter johnsonii TaxID=40214 RepID=UPI00244A0522|nr:hypothetical protein [Acinetobacter johnsonii]MDH0711993.1 hypothetical protein [Acinetobacter johnsonii]MDV2486326.1 hypothetical protein [Acinetobacter johnsonii]
MDNSKLPINQIIEKLKQASESKQGITLNSDEVVELYEEFKDLVYIPVLSMEELAELSKKD